MQQGYLNDPAISFCAIGDAKCDAAPLQVTDFGQGQGLDQLLSRVWLEGGGGGNEHESYELSAYFYSKRCDITNSKLPFFFVTGDEGFWETIPSKTVKDKLGSNMEGNGMNAEKVWKELAVKYNVFHLHKPYDSGHDKKIVRQWKNALGKERILKMKTPKACIDVILGAIALVSKTRTMDAYINDMKERGQDDQRIAEVSSALAPLWSKIASNSFPIVQGKQE